MGEGPKLCDICQASVLASEDCDLRPAAAVHLVLASRLRTLQGAEKRTASIIMQNNHTKWRSAERGKTSTRAFNQQNCVSTGIKKNEQEPTQ